MYRHNSGGDQCGKGVILTEVVTFDLSVNHLRASYAIPVDAVASLSGQLPNKLALRASVSFSKRMDRVQFAEIVGRTTGKCSGIQSF
jgi:acyl-coenzyme A thioesterase PaaI-like protein